MRSDEFCVCAKPIYAEKCEGSHSPVLYIEDVSDMAQKQLLIAWKEEGLFHTFVPGCSHGTIPDYNVYS